jgi:predicted kinase
MIHCRAELPILRARLAERRRAGLDTSEADDRVLDWQLQRYEPMESREGAEVIEIDTARPDLVAFAKAQIARLLPGLAD